MKKSLCHIVTEDSRAARTNQRTGNDKVSLARPQSRGPRATHTNRMALCPYPEWPCAPILTGLVPLPLEPLTVPIQMPQATVTPTIAGMCRGTKSMSMPSSEKYPGDTLAGAVEKQFGMLWTTAPVEWCAGGNTEQVRNELTNRIAPLFGEAFVTRVYTKSKFGSNPTGNTRHTNTAATDSTPAGEISIRVKRLSSEGAARVTRGYLRLGEAGQQQVARGIVVRKDHSIAAMQLQPPTSDNSCVVRGDGKWGTYAGMAREVLTQVTLPPLTATLDAACCLIHLPTQALTTLSTT